MASRVYRVVAPATGASTSTKPKCIFTPPAIILCTSADIAINRIGAISAKKGMGLMPMGSARTVEIWLIKNVFNAMIGILALLVPTDT